MAATKSRSILPTATIEGDGWINVREIRINGSPERLPVTWIDGDTWRITIPVVPGTNTITLTAFDHQGTLIGTDTITVNGTGLIVPASAENLVVSEIMYQAATAGPDEFIEVRNISNQTIDLTNCAFSSGLDYNFVSGTTLAPHARMVLPQTQFLNGTSLANGGERIILTGAGGVIIKDFAYDDEPPWPTSPDGRRVEFDPDRSRNEPESQQSHELAPERRSRRQPWNWRCRAGACSTARRR